MADKKIRSVAKTFSWRLFIFIYWVIFGYIYTGTFVGAGILGVFGLEFSEMDRGSRTDGRTDGLWDGRTDGGTD